MKPVSYLCSFLMAIPEYHNLNMDKNHVNAMANTLFKYRSYLYSPSPEREREKQILKLSVD